MRRRALGLALLAATALPPARANAVPPELAGELPGARPIGSGRLRFMGLHVYDARLWAADAPVDPLAEPLALEIEYGRRLVGTLIAERSLDEMKRQGPIDEPTAARWLASMRSLFPDVAAGDRLTGVHRPREAARFFHNGRLRGEVRDGDFARRFFGIWLAPQTSEPALREALLGRRP
jgi:hypothetical protein